MMIKRPASCFHEPTDLTFSGLTTILVDQIQVAKIRTARQTVTELR
jgi:hypothetical protein